MIVEKSGYVSVCQAKHIWLCLQDAHACSDIPYSAVLLILILIHREFSVWSFRIEDKRPFQSPCGEGCC